MPITRTKTEQVTRTLILMTLQEYADQTLPDAYQQPLKTLHEALAVNEWMPDHFPDDYKPVCCGQVTECSSFLGGAYLACCKKCGRFIYDVTGPEFGNSWVSFPDAEKVDLETDMERRWIAGIKDAPVGGGK